MSVFGVSGKSTVLFTIVLAAMNFGSALDTSNLTNSSKEQDTGIFYGPERQLGAGRVRSYLKLDNNRPVELGIRMSETALRSSAAGEKWKPGMHHQYAEHILELPEQASLTPFRFLELDWNPGGHEPPGVYDEPHFDFHFYTISKSERDAIDPEDPEYMEKAERLPQPEAVPAGYVLPPLPATLVPRMGVHWVNGEAEELNGKPFRQTFIRGSWNGRMIFHEPMITKAYLESRPNVVFPIAQARCHEPAGHYPSSYGIRYDEQNHEYQIYLSDFEHRGCSNGHESKNTPALK